MKIVIIGASHSGIACARRARQEYPEAQVIMLEKKVEISFISQNILFYLLNQDQRILDAGKYITVEQIKAEGIDLRTNVEVRKVDVDNKSLQYISYQDHQKYQESFDKLVLAIGSYPTLPIVQGETPKNLYILKTYEDALKINHWLSKQTSKKSILILGAGTIGVELSRILNKRHCKVSLMNRSDYLMHSYFDAEASLALEKYLLSEGIEIRKNDEIARLSQASDGKIKVTTVEKKELEFDALIFTAGFRPNSLLVKGQLEINESNGTIKTDEYQRTSRPDVFAIGDCTSNYINLAHENIYQPNAEDAIRQGEIAALNLQKPRQKINPTQGVFVLDMKDLKICSVGLTVKRAQEAGWNMDCISYENPYYGGFGYQMWLVYERDTHLILGAQILGAVDNCDMYANLISLAIEQNLSIDDIEFSDFYLEHGFQNPLGFTKIFADLIRAREKG